MEDNACDTRLPERLFATDRFPRNRLNIYSRPNILAFVRHVLHGSEAFAKIRKSSFGKLFDLPTRQCPVSYLADELEHDHQMDEWRRIWLALIIILDGVLIASQQIHRPTQRYVQMLDDVDAFLEFPWGRESFLHTVRCMKPPKFEKGKTVDSPIDMLVLKLKQETYPCPSTNFPQPPGFPPLPSGHSSTGGSMGHFRKNHGNQQKSVRHITDLLLHTVPSTFSLINYLFFFTMYISFHVPPSKLDFSNQFLLQLATPSQWTDSLHMAVLMHILDMHHKDVLQMENATFMPPTVTSLMQSKDRQFQAAVKKDKIRWDHRVSKLILLPGKTWMKEFQKVYTPMIWADRHWAGPILQMLPYLIRYLVKNNSRDLSPFTCQRRTGTYENTRSGDCGPVCAKFLELHLFGDPYPHMSGLTDAMVDKFRQQYAMEAYKTIVLPAYY
ncbi:hypothetical protein F2Q68_00021287 [Brassica cretica]|uniref:Ubiquitin-like protease family profile domain-containing protein n=1 Tax=Brassica cretica TaxID=69181 RepID=A0A8S9G0W1_BRACR|nr:hypothetical protein F2Q68_00021287 [Brassica cretica]